MGVGVSMNRSRIADENGASSVEYGLIVAGIAALSVTIVFVLGGNIKTNLYDKTAACIEAGADSEC